MSDENTKNPNPPETHAPPMRVYEAGESVHGLSPKLQYTEHKKMSPHEFGCTVKQSLEKSAFPALAAVPGYIGTAAASMAPWLGWEALQQYLSPTSQYGRAALTGLGTAGLVGAAHGFMSPGEDTEYDEDGNVVGKKRRSRLMGALRGAVPAAAFGGAAGLAMEHLAPGTTGQIHNSASRFGKQVGATLGLRKPQRNRNWTGWAVENALATNPGTALGYWTGATPKSVYQNSWTGETL